MKKYKTLAEALKSCPKSDEEFLEQLEQENSETSETPNMEQQEPTNKYIVRFITHIKKPKQFPKKHSELKKE